MRPTACACGPTSSLFAPAYVLCTSLFPQKSAAIIAALRLIQQDQGEEAAVTESLPAAPEVESITEVVMPPVPTEEEEEQAPAMELEVGPAEEEEEEVQEPKQEPEQEPAEEPAEEPAQEPLQAPMEEPVIPEPLVQEPLVQEEPAQPPSDGVEQEQDHEMDEDDKDVAEEVDAVVTDSMETEVVVAEDASDNMAAQAVTEPISAAQELPAVDPVSTLSFLAEVLVLCVP